MKLFLGSLKRIIKPCNIKEGTLFHSNIHLHIGTHTYTALNTMCEHSVWGDELLKHKRCQQLLWACCYFWSCQCLYSMYFFYIWHEYILLLYFAVPRFWTNIIPLQHWSKTGNRICLHSMPTQLLKHSTKCMNRK